MYITGVLPIYIEIPLFNSIRLIEIIRTNRLLKSARGAAGGYIFLLLTNSI